MKSRSLSDSFYALVRRIPRGKVTTYGALATHLNLPSPRYAGYLLHHNPDPETIPCHRVVNFKGECAKNFAFGFAQAQEQLLKDEGVTFIQNRVDLRTHLWDIPSQS